MMADANGIVFEILIKKSVELILVAKTEEIDDNIRSTERVLAELRDAIEHIEAQPSEELVFQRMKERDLLQRMKKLESDASNLTETCMKKLEQMQRRSASPVVTLVVTLVKYRRMNKELLKMRKEITRILNTVNDYNLYHKQEEADTSNLLDTTFKSRISAYATSAVRNLELALGVLLYSVPQEQYREVRRIRSQLLPVFEILKKVEYEPGDERQNVWMHMVEDIFKSIDEELVSLQQLQLVNKSVKSQGKKFCEFVLKKKEEIFILWSRWHTYGVGAFKGLYGSNLVVPHMESDMLRSKLFLTAEAERIVNLQPLIKSFSEFDETAERYKKERELIIEGFRIDQALVNALLKDAKGMEEVDERGKFWLKIMKELHRELEVVVVKHSYFRSLFVSIINRITIVYRPLVQSASQSASLVEEFIYILTMWKRCYRMDSFVQRDGPRSKHTEEEDEEDGDTVSLTSNLFKGDHRVQLVQIELQLMEALFQDVKTISQQDERLKVWIQEMRCVANYVKPIIQQILNRSFTSKVAATKLDLISERIRHISEWSLTYDIGSIRSAKVSSSLIQELEEVRPYPTDPVAEHVDLIRREARMMQALDTDIQKMHGSYSGTLEAWLGEMREVAGEAEILISSYSNNGNDVELIKSKIQRLHQRRREYGIEHFDRKLSHAAEELRARLLADKTEPFMIIPVLGAWDNDKEFIKKFIEEDDRIVSQFTSRIWLSAGEANERTILENIARVMEPTNFDGSLIVSQAEEILEDELKQNQSLIVLDELQNPFILISVRELLRRTSRGSRIICITSQIDVDLSGLSQFEMLSSITMRVLPPHRNMSMLHMVQEKSDSNQIPTTLNPSADPIPSDLRECLYYFLLFSPKNSKNSENYIPIRRLVSLWIAEGFVRRKRGEDDVPLELIAMRYLSKLKELGVVETTEKGGKPRRCRLKDDKRETCLSNAKQKQFFQEKKENPGQGKYFGVEIGNIVRLTDQPGDVNNNACHYHIHDPDNHPVSLTSHYRTVRSLLSFDTQERRKPGEDIGIFLDKGISKKCFLSLHILDLEHIFRPALPKELAKLIRLRYLGLRWTYLEALPQSVSDLLNLQALDVKHTYISRLPKSIWRMQYLRHLYLSETYRTRFDDKPYDSMSLKNLQTLWGAFVDEDSPVEGGLDTVLSVRKLGLLCRSMYHQKKMETQLEAVANWVVSLKDLESLRLKSQDEKGIPSYLYLRPLSAHIHLSVLHISGILKYPSVISDLPLNLSEVTLSGCKLKNDPLHSMEFLPRLIVLRLLGDSSKCRKMRCSSRGFPKLEVLRLWKLEMLVALEVEKGGMPLLEDFEIRSCPNLEKLKVEEGSMPLLQHMEIRSCPNSEKLKVEEGGMPSDLYLKPFSANEKISVLHIVGMLKYSSVISDLPLNLTEVTLSGCELENDPLYSLEYLPRLIILRLLEDASKCRKMICSSRGFPKLEVLKLWKLEMLVELEVEEGGMPLLKGFEIRSCPSLEKLKVERAGMPLLQHLETTSCPKLEELPDRSFQHMSVKRHSIKRTRSL